MFTRVYAIVAFVIVMLLASVMPVNAQAGRPYTPWAGRGRYVNPSAPATWRYAGWEQANVRALTDAGIRRIERPTAALTGGGVSGR